VTGLPIVVRGADVHVLVVGGGAVGTRKALAMLDAGFRVRVVAPEVSAALLGRAATDPALHVEARAFERDDVRAAALVVAATDRRDVNAAVAEAAAERQVLVNVADEPDAGSFQSAALHRTGPLLVAVSAGGVPTAAARVRDAIAGRFDARFGDAVARLGALRRALLADGRRARWQEAADALVGDDFVTSVESGAFEERVRRWA
jgi:siroheme synthase-like protein